MPNVPPALAVELPAYAYARARSAHFAAQYTLLNAISSVLPGVKPSIPPIQSEAIQSIRKELATLLRQDARNIRDGLYPVSVLKPESPIAHARRIKDIFFDGISIYRRRVRGRTTEFRAPAREMLGDLPRYYRRNFHFQTDGYLSEHSAELYEHQVEMLFSGTADAMRRLIIPPMKQALLPKSGAGLRILEIGAGTGRATRFVRAAFPKARIVATDLSDPYLKVARRKIADLEKIDLIQAAGESLPFQDGHFDAVYSVFLFHELPLAVRKQVIAESRRVLKPGGFLGLVDSIQGGEVPAFDELLENFPRNYHEPFFRNYLSHPMEKILRETGFKSVQTDRGFFSKVCWAKR